MAVDRQELDRLLEDFQADRLTPDSALRLRLILIDIMNGLVDDAIAGNRVAAAIVLRVIEQRYGNGNDAD